MAEIKESIDIKLGKENLTKRVGTILREINYLQYLPSSNIQLDANNPYTANLNHYVADAFTMASNKYKKKLDKNNRFYYFFVEVLLPAVKLVVCGQGNCQELASYFYCRWLQMANLDNPEEIAAFIRYYSNKLKKLPNSHLSHMATIENERPLHVAVAINLDMDLDKYYNNQILSPRISDKTLVVDPWIRKTGSVLAITQLVKKEIPESDEGVFSFPSESNNLSILKEIKALLSQFKEVCQELKTLYKLELEQFPICSTLNSRIALGFHYIPGLCWMTNKPVNILEAHLHLKEAYTKSSNEFGDSLNVPQSILEIWGHLLSFADPEALQKIALDNTPIVQELVKKCKPLDVPKPLCQQERYFTPSFTYWALNSPDDESLSPFPRVVVNDMMTEQSRRERANARP